jgi:hypothetical protein
MEWDAANELRSPLRLVEDTIGGYVWTGIGAMSNFAFMDRTRTNETINHCPLSPSQPMPATVPSLCRREGVRPSS